MKKLLIAILFINMAQAQTVTVNELNRSGIISLHAFNPITTPEYRSTVTFVSSHTLELSNSILTSTDFSEEYNVISVSDFQARLNEARTGDGLFGTIHGDRRSILFLNTIPEHYLPLGEVDWTFSVSSVTGVFAISPNDAYTVSFLFDQWSIRHNRPIPNFIGYATDLNNDNIIDAADIIIWYNQQ